MSNSSRPTESDVRAALSKVIDPEIRRSIAELGMIQAVEINDEGGVHVVINLTTPGCPLKREIHDDVTAHLMAVEGVTDVSVEFGHMTSAERTELRNRLRGEAGMQESKTIRLPDSCRVIAVTSGKGGVGKSTVAANLAVSLAQAGHEVGILDADVHGYSIPQMLGIDQRPVVLEGMMIPPVAYGVRVMSIGFFIDEDNPVMWRGPMLHKVIEQFLGDVHWGEIEYLVVDMPPGTGDAAISVGQLLPRSEVVVVTTPQVAAQRVAQRAAVMATKLDQHLIGVVENMSTPPGVSDEDSPFGTGGGQVLADAVAAPLIASLPLDAATRRGGDAGRPITLDDDIAAGQAHRDLAERIVATEAPAPPPPEPAARIKKPLTML